MKRIFLILFLGGLFLFYWADKEQENEEVERKDVLISQKSSAVDFYNKYPMEVIPYQIPYTNYILEVRLLNFSSTLMKNVFTKSQDENTIDGYEDGMKINIQYSVKNPYEREMWIPVPSNLEITSNDYPSDHHISRSGIHPHNDYLSDGSRFVGKEPNYKRDSFNHKLYYLSPADSLILEVQFKNIPYSQNIIVCGVSIFQNERYHEKGLLIDTKQNSILGQVVF